ncbi:MAG: UDP-2,3-diacylglucosamine diphosphatase [Methanothrix sp.]|nr:MAG: UDP-2,3-diacylglucosamine diphosphatase [Methanothrix sp.]
MASIVISDTHFGLSTATLNDPKKVEQLMQELALFGGDCDEVVLLGDVFDLWRVNPEKAIRDSRTFLTRLSIAFPKIRYILGNHDHHLVVLHQEDEFMERMARGDLYPVYIPVLHWQQVLDNLNVDMFYPFYRIRCCHRNIVFTHGHHLGGIQAFSMQLVKKLRRLSGEETLPADLETMMTYAYESIYRSASIGEMVNFEDSLWKASGLLQWFRAGVTHSSRFTPVERQYPAILKFLRDQNLGKVDCFIYGDTHRAGIYQRKGGPLAVNAGCFLPDDGCGSIPELPNTYLILDDDGITMRQLGRPEPLFICELL